MYAAPAVFVNVCQRHRFESVQVPLAEERGWPTRINWAELGERVREMRERLKEIVDDVDEEFSLGRERTSGSGSLMDLESDEKGKELGNEDEVDDDELRKTRPRKGSEIGRAHV